MTYFFTHTAIFVFQNLCDSSLESYFFFFVTSINRCSKENVQNVIVIIFIPFVLEVVVIGQEVASYNFQDSSSFFIPP